MDGQGAEVPFATTDDSQAARYGLEPHVMLHKNWEVTSKVGREGVACCSACAVGVMLHASGIG